MRERFPWQLLFVGALTISLLTLRYRTAVPDVDPSPTPSSIADTAEAMQLVESRLRCELYFQVAREVDSGKLVDGRGIQEALRSGNLDIARRVWLPLDELAERSIPAEELQADTKPATLRYLQEVARGFQRAARCP
jgi:hypothetical protein